MTASIASAAGMPSNGPELTITSSGVRRHDALVRALAVPGGGSDHVRIGRPYFFANSKSRSSCAGHAP